jgi:hypothetical protein
MAFPARTPSRFLEGVLRLLETFSLVEVTVGMQALHLRTIAFDAVEHLALCATEQRPPKLDLESHPHFPVAEVALTRAAGHQMLLAGTR